MLGDKTLAKTALEQLQAAFGTFAANKQKYPLVHESKFLLARVYKCAYWSSTDREI
jgi:endoglucanase Acf2